MASRSVPITWVEVFAEQPLQGNLLPVLHEADGVAGGVLERVARRFLQPETSALLSADGPGVSYRHRIFTVASEIPFAGHPSLGAAAAHAHRSGVRSGTFVQQTLSGRQELDVELADCLGRVTLHQDPATFGPVIDPGPILEALGLDATASLPGLPAQIVSTGLPALIIPVEVEALRHARFNRSKLTSALQGLPGPGSLNCYLVAPAGTDTWRARSFALDLSVGEDPATGSAAGPFGAYLRQHRGEESLVVDQGSEMGSPSRLYVDTTVGIAVAGAVRVVSTGTYHLPGEGDPR
jgi:trans-2,3-dihydro-3-hydroxyanthranilate isomerase